MIYLSTYLSIYLSINPSIDRSVDRSIQYINQSINQSIYLSIYRSINPSIDRSVDRSIQYINQSINQSIYLSIYLGIYLSRNLTRMSILSYLGWSYITYPVYLAYLISFLHLFDFSELFCLMSLIGLCVWLSVYRVVRYKGGFSTLQLHVIAVQVSWKQFSSLYSWKWDWPTNICSIGSGCHLQLLRTKFHLQAMQNSWQMAPEQIFTPCPRLFSGYLIFNKLLALRTGLECLDPDDFIAILRINSSQPQVKKHLLAQTRGWATQIGGAGAVTTNTVFHLWAGALHEATIAIFHLCWGIRCELRHKSFKFYFKNSRSCNYFWNVFPTTLLTFFFVHDWHSQSFNLLSM